MSKRIWFFNFFKAISVLAVVLTHSLPALYEFNSIGIKHWLIVDAVFSFLRFTVPFFIMITGAITLRAKATNKQYENFYRNACKT